MISISIYYTAWSKSFCHASGTSNYACATMASFWSNMNFIVHHTHPALCYMLSFAVSHNESPSSSYYCYLAKLRVSHKCNFRKRVLNDNGKGVWRTTLSHLHIFDASCSEFSTFILFSQITKNNHGCHVRNLFKHANILCLLMLSPLYKCWNYYSWWWQELPQGWR